MEIQIAILTLLFGGVCILVGYAVRDYVDLWRRIKEESDEVQR